MCNEQFHLNDTAFLDGVIGFMSENKSAVVQEQQQSLLMGAAARGKNPFMSDFADFQKQQVGDAIVEAHRLLVKEIPVQKLPESVFLKEIMPFLCGDSASQVSPEKWIAVAGSPFSEIDIIDDAGNTLFRLPALFERNVVSHESASKRGSLVSAMITLGMLRNFSPARAEAFLKHEFDGRGIATDYRSVAQTTAARWDEIFRRYGKQINPEKGIVEDVQGNTSSRVSVNGGQPTKALSHDSDDLL